MYRVNVDLRNTNEDFAETFVTETEAHDFIAAAMREGYVVQVKTGGAVKIYHPIASVKTMTIVVSVDPKMFAPGHGPRTAKA